MRGLGGTIVSPLETKCFLYVRSGATSACMSFVDAIMVNTFSPFFAFLNSKVAVFKTSPTGGRRLTGEAGQDFEPVF